MSKLTKRVASFLTVLVITATFNSAAFALDAPVLTLRTSGLNVSLSWTSVPEATGYNLYYAPYPYAGAHTIGSVDIGANTFFSATLSDSASYYVAITASNGSSESGYSNVELVALTNTACGGGGSDGSCEYELKSYLITSDSSHKYWDRYLFDGSQFNISQKNIAETNELNLGDVIETPTFGTIAFTDNGISRVNQNDNFEDLIQIGDNWFNVCVWNAHYETLLLENGSTYQDVLELSCGEKVFYFSKDNGNIAMDYVENGNTYKYLVSSIKVGALTFGDILNAFGEDILKLY